jgi:hypothetical protein
VPGLAVAGADELAVGAGADALDRGDLALQRRHHLGHRDLVGGPSQTVAAVRAAPALDQVGAAQPGHQVLEVGERQPLGVGDRRQRDRLLTVAAGQVRHDAHAVFGFGGEHHFLLPK